MTKQTGYLYHVSALSGVYDVILVGAKNLHHYSPGGYSVKSYFGQEWSQIKESRDKGIILIEGLKESTAPLRLEIRRDGALHYSYSLPLVLTNVEDMFSHKDLRVGLGENIPDRYKDRNLTVDPPNLPEFMKYNPDGTENLDKLVMIHGFNVTAESVAGTYAEVFKRLFHAGLNARFYGVGWYGNQPAPPANGPPSSHYHQAIVGAIASAQGYADFVKSLPGQVTLLAHSAGNMVASVAIQDHNVAKNNETTGYSFNGYIAMDAAVALEAYGDTVTPEMAKNAGAEDTKSWMYQVGKWYDYVIADQGRLLASEWYKLFRVDPDEINPDDFRSTLTWRFRLGDVPSEKVFNFYSSTEDVLRNWQGDDLVIGGGIFDMSISPLEFELRFSRYSWVKQEKFKGRREKLIANIAGAGNPYCGWGFPDEEGQHTNPEKCTGVDGPQTCYVRKTPIEMVNVPDTELRSNPFFDLRDENYPAIGALLGDSTTASNFLKALVNDTPLKGYYDYNAKANEIITVRDWLLAESFPATSFAAGSNINKELLPYLTNYDMSATMKTDEHKWPRKKENANDTSKEWRHSDYTDMPYQHVFRLYKKFKNISHETK